MNKKSILFYVLSVLFLGIAVYMGVSAFLTLSASAQQYGISLTKEWSTVLQNIFAASGGFLAFSLILCGIGMILGDLGKDKPAVTNKENKKAKKELVTETVETEKLPETDSKTEESKIDEE